MTILYAARLYVEQLTMDRDLVHLRDRLAPEIAEMVYYGFWYTAKMDALMAFIHQAEQVVNGEVTLGLYKGNVSIHSRKSPYSLYDAEVASMEGGGSYDQTDAEGFLRLQGLPSRVQGLVRPRARSCSTTSRACGRRSSRSRRRPRRGPAAIQTSENPGSAGCDWGRPGAESSNS